jgi:hypothetical protein
LHLLQFAPRVCKRRFSGTLRPNQLFPGALRLNSPYSGALRPNQLSPGTWKAISCRRVIRDPIPLPCVLPLRLKKSSLIQPRSQVHPRVRPGVWLCNNSASPSLGQYIKIMTNHTPSFILFSRSNNSHPRAVAPSPWGPSGPCPLFPGFSGPFPRSPGFLGP